MTKLLDTNKWKPLFTKMTDPDGFGVDMYWQMAKTGRNRAPTLSRVEKKDFDEISGHKFP